MINTEYILDQFEVLENNTKLIGVELNKVKIQANNLQNKINQKYSALQEEANSKFEMLIKQLQSKL